MRLNTIYAIIMLMAVAAFYACNKDYEMKADYTDQSNKSYVRIIHAAPNFRALTNFPDSFNLYINSARINSPFLTYGSVFPAAANSSYASVNGGVNLLLRLAVGSTNNPDSASLQSAYIPDTVRVGAKRTYVIADSSNSISVLKINDVYSTPQPGYYNLRFMHMVLNDTAGRTVDIYSTRRNGNIFTNIAPKSVSGFTLLATFASLNDTLYVRRSGTTFNLAAGVLPAGLAFLPGSQRTYSLLYRGNANLTTGTKARTLTMITNE